MGDTFITIPSFVIKISSTETPVPPVTDPIPAGPVKDYNGGLCNRNKNGDVVLPYHYQDTYWDVYYDLDISDRTSAGLFNLTLRAVKTPMPNIQPQVVLHLQNAVAGKVDLNLTTIAGKQYLALGADHKFDLKALFAIKKMEYNISQWGDSSYIYFHVGEKKYSSGIFFIFTADSGSDYIRP
jgi:hypothetical protein